MIASSSTDDDRSESERDAAYYRVRAAKERTLAELSADPVVAAIHREMAERYSDLAVGGGALELKLVR